MTARNELISAMPKFLGPFVLNCKHKSSQDTGMEPVFTLPMAKAETKTEHRAAFMARVKRAREDRGFTQADMAELLGMEQGRYKQYETRSYLPHELVHKFCLACGVDVVWLFTGHSRHMPSAEPVAAAPKKRRAKSRDRAA